MGDFPLPCLIPEVFPKMSQSQKSWFPNFQALPKFWGQNDQNAKKICKTTKKTYRVLDSRLMYRATVAIQIAEEEGVLCRNVPQLHQTIFGPEKSQEMSVDVSRKTTSTLELVTSTDIVMFGTCDDLCFLVKCGHQSTRRSC